MDQIQVGDIVLVSCLGMSWGKFSSDSFTVYVIRRITTKIYISSIEDPETILTIVCIHGKLYIKNFTSPHNIYFYNLGGLTGVSDIDAQILTKVESEDLKNLRLISSYIDNLCKEKKI